jgi:uncharacterized protein with PQ loop repeat
MIRYQIATLSVGIALFLDSMSYYKQIKKTIRTKKSSQVSSSSFLYKIAKALFAMVGLSIYNNRVGLGMESFMLIIYAISLAVIAHYKPKGWRLLK